MLSSSPRNLLIAQILAHLAIIPMIMYATWWQWAIAIFVYFLNGCLGMTMTYHRLLSHKAWNPAKWVEYLFALFATIGMTGPAISWVAIHRKHHGFVDTEKDPHSPSFKGFFWVHFLSMFAKVEVRYAAHLLREKFYVWQHKYYFHINLVYAAVLFALDPFAIVYAWLVPAMMLWNGGSTIVSVSHRNGKANSDTLLALLVWGEGYHEEHHGKANAKRFGKYDLGGILIEQYEKFDKPKALGDIT